MRRYDYSEFEKQINAVLAYQNTELDSIQHLDRTILENRIRDSESLLSELGYSLPDRLSENKSKQPKRVMIVPTWESLCMEAESAVGMDHNPESLFTEDELKQNSEVINQLNAEFNMVYHLDKFDILISATAGLLGAAIDVLLVGIPTKRPKVYLPENFLILSEVNLINVFLRKKWRNWQIQK